ncbi:MAG: hypothetical protein ACR2O9_01385 [Alphaproteobacteria bacterium]
MEKDNMMKNERFISKNKKNILEVYDTRLELKKPWSDCERQLCACSKPDNPVFRYQCENGRGCGNFQRMDFGCYTIGIGKAPVKNCGKNCNCSCHKVSNI